MPWGQVYAQMKFESPDGYALHRAISMTRLRQTTGLASQVVGKLLVGRRGQLRPRDRYAGTLAHTDGRTRKLRLQLASLFSPDGFRLVDEQTYSWSPGSTYS